MSIVATRWVWFHSKSSGLDRLVLLALSFYADDEGTAWPAMTTLAEMCNCSTRSVRRSLLDLEAIGEVNVVHRGGPAERRDRRTKLYRVPVEERPSYPQRGDDTSSRKGPTRGQGVPNEGTNATVTRGRHVPRTSIELQEELGCARPRGPDVPSACAPCGHGEARGPRFCALCRRAGALR